MGFFSLDEERKTGLRDLVFFRSERGMEVFNLGFRAARLS